METKHIVLIVVCALAILLGVPFVANYKAKQEKEAAAVAAQQAAEKAQQADEAQKQARAAAQAAAQQAAQDLIAAKQSVHAALTQQGQLTVIIGLRTDPFVYHKNLQCRELRKEILIEHKALDIAANSPDLRPCPICLHAEIGR